LGFLRNQNERGIAPSKPLWGDINKAKGTASGFNTPYILAHHKNPSYDHVEVKKLKNLSGGFRVASPTRPKNIFKLNLMALTLGLGFCYLKKKSSTFALQSDKAFSRSESNFLSN
jgi:hypothetical protein